MKSNKFKGIPQQDIILANTIRNNCLTIGDKEDIEHLEKLEGATLEFFEYEFLLEIFKALLTGKLTLLVLSQIKY